MLLLLRQPAAVAFLGMGRRATTSSALFTLVMAASWTVAMLTGADLRAIGLVSGTQLDAMRQFKGRT